MYFVHPQIKISLGNLKKILFSFVKNPPTQKIGEIFPLKEIVFTDMGRNAFRLIIENFNLRGKEILLPAFICDIFLSLLQEYKLKPIFADVEKKTFNISPEEIEKRITPQTKAVLLCHTFGLPAQIPSLKKEVLLIEDCAHSFLAKTKDRFCGSFGQASFFSLYKQFPIMRGGMAVFTKKENPFPLPKTRLSFRDFLSFLNYFSFFAFLFKIFGNKIAPKIIRKEKRSLPASINPISLKLFFGFLQNYENELKKRKKIALCLLKKLQKFPFEFQESKNNIFTFFSFLVPKFIFRDHFVKFLRKKRIFATRIWKDPLICHPLLEKEYGIKKEDFPNTLEISRRIVNLPLQSYYQEKDLEKITQTIEEYFLMLKTKF